MIPQLLTPRLVLRPLNISDAPALFEARRDPETIGYWDRPPQGSVDDVAKIMADHGRAIAGGSALWWAVAHCRRMGQRSGNATSLAIDHEDRRGEIGFLFRRSSWGKGYAREAMTCVLAYAFGPLELERLGARLHAGKERSRRLLEKLGFSCEGTMRGYLVREGLRMDCSLFGMLRDVR